MLATAAYLLLAVMNISLCWPEATTPQDPFPWHWGSDQRRNHFKMQSAERCHQMQTHSVKKKASSSNNFATKGFKRDYVFCALQQPSVSIKKKSRAWVNLTKMQLSTQTGCGSILPRQVREPGTELGRVEPQLRQKFGDKHDITPTGWKHFDRWALHQKIQFLSKSKHLKGMCYFLRHFSASARIFSTLFLIFAF